MELHTDGSPTSILMPLDDPWLIAGTDPTCGLRLSGPQVEPAHYAWFWLAGQLYGLDLSMNGTAPAIPFEGWWRDGAQIRIGTHRLRYHASPAVPEPFHPDRPLPELSLSAGTGRRSLRLERWFTLIGRDRRCELVLDEPGVADRQAALIRTPDSLWLVNLAEASPPRSGGRPRAWLSLDPLDEFTIGQTTFRIESNWAEAAPTPVSPAVDPGTTTDPVAADRARLAVLHAALGQLLDQRDAVDPAASDAVLAAVRQLVSQPAP
jgi:hypothetical protein